MFFRSSPPPGSPPWCLRFTGIPHFSKHLCPWIIETLILKLSYWLYDFFPLISFEFIGDRYYSCLLLHPQLPSTCPPSYPRQGLSKHSEPEHTNISVKENLLGKAWQYCLSRELGFPVGCEKVEIRLRDPPAGASALVWSFTCLRTIGLFPRADEGRQAWTYLRTEASFPEAEKC